MKNSVVNIVIYGYEKGIIVNALNNLRTSYLINNEDTELIDALLLKVIEAPVKKPKKLKLLEAR